MKSQPAPDADLHSAPKSQQATGRFVEERVLGQGTMGIVHLVRDRETGEQLARKKLLRVDAKSVLRLKREFRTLADVSHPNLVKLYELGRENDIWFLTMEYVPGVELKAHLECEPDRIELTGELVAGRAQLHVERVLDAFHQLAAGVVALHRARVLHRDLKPSNVLVAGERVVVLDFGLARRMDEQSVFVTEDGQSAGTPAYMAPEQVRGLPLTEASDWYAFGAMFYEALTGLLPYDGSVHQLLAKKLDSDPVPPIEIEPALPAGLNALCLALLSRVPESRPNGAEILLQLEAARSRLQQSGRAEELRTTLVSEQAPPLQSGAAALYGRDQPLRVLHAALQRVATTNRTLQVHVRGVSGAGKSALVEKFLNQIEAASKPQALVLRSRCYEREAMPFKALDGVVDALSRYFLSVEDIQVSHLLPRDVIALAKLFPVLERLRAVQRLMESSRPFYDAVGDRQRAESALRELIERLAARTPVVIWIDDLQWGDLDSAVILKSWLQRTMDRPVLVLLSYRADEMDTSECLRLILGSEGDGDGDAERAQMQIIDVSPLAATDVVAICRDHLTELSDHDPLIQRIVQESQGSPFFAAQLASLAHAKLARGTHDIDICSIDGLIAQTQAFLSPQAQTLLAVLAVAGRPILPKLALDAAQLDKGGRDFILELRRLQLVRSRDVAGERMLEVYHDRVREAVQRALDPVQCQRVYAALLAALSGGGLADPDWLHALASGADDRPAALRYGLLAAERAQAALAFERAAELYKRCSELCDSDADLRLQLLRKRAAALGWCGRGALAADVCIEAAKSAPEREVLQLMRLATSHLLRSGRFAEGEAMLQRVLAQLGEEVSLTPAGLMRSIVWERLRMATRGGMAFSARREDEIPAGLLERIDTFDTLRVDSTAMNPMRAYLFLLRSTRWALEAGEPMRVLRALGANCYAEANGGTPRAVRRADQLLAHMAELAQKIGTPQARIEECVIRALTCWLLGRADAVLAPAHEAEQLLSKLGPNEHGADYLARRATRSARIGALFELAEYGAFASELQTELQQVRAVDNVAAVLQLSLNETLLDELLDRRDHVITRLEQQRKQLPPVDFSVFHALHMIAVCRAGGLSGQGKWAIALLEQDWPRFQRSPLRTAANLAMHARHTRLHLLVTQHILTSSSVTDVPAAIRAEMRALSARDPRSTVSILHQTARLALAAGDRERAVELLRRAGTYDGPGIHGDRVRFGLGVVMGGQEGAALCAESERALNKRGLAQLSGCLRADIPELFGGEWR